MSIQNESRRRLRLERLEGRWLMAAGGIDLLDATPFHPYEPSESDTAQVDRRQQQGDLPRDHQQPQRHDQGRNTIDSDRVDQALRQRDFHRPGEPIRDQQQRPARTPRDARPPASNASQTQSSLLQAPVFPSQIGTQTQIGAQTLPPSAARNPVLPIDVPFLSRGTSPVTPLNTPQGEQPLVRVTGNDGNSSTANEPERVSNERTAETVGPATVLAEIANHASNINTTNETTLVSFHSRSADLLSTDGSSSDLLSQLTDNTEQEFFEFADEAIRQSGLSQWLNESESMQLELSELDRLLDTLAQSEARVAELHSRQMPRNVASAIYSASSNDWAHSVGQMIILLPGTDAQPNLVGDFSIQPAETSAPWSAGIGLYRAFDFAGFDTELDQAVANVSVSVDADSWNLASDGTHLERPATQLPESLVLPISTTTTLGFAVTVLGAHYLRGRYRRILLSKHQPNAHSTDLDAGRNE